MFNPPAWARGLFPESFYIGLNSQRGGARPGAGRKPKSRKVEDHEKEKLNRMAAARADLLFQLHNPEFIHAFVSSLREDITNGKPHIRERALKILAEIYLRMPLPKPVEGKSDGVMTVQQLIEEYQDKIANGILNDGSDGGDLPEPEESEDPEESDE